MPQRWGNGEEFSEFRPPSTSTPHSLIYAWKTVRRFLYFSEEVLFMNPVLLWALVGVISIVTIYFVWGRKLGKKEEAK